MGRWETRFTQMTPPANTACYFLFMVNESMGNKYIGQELGAFLYKMELGRETEEIKRDKGRLKAF